MLAQFSMAALFITETATVPLLTICMLINGTAMALHAPAATGLIIQLVPRERLQSTNALLGTARNSAVAGGAALGGVLVATVGAGPTLAIDALSFGISACLVATLVPRVQQKAAQSSMFAELKEGWQEFTSHTWLWVIVAQFSLVVAASEAVFGLIGPAVARDQMGGAVDWGMIASGFGVGTLLGGITAIKVRPRYPMRFATILVLFFSGVSVAIYFQAPLPMIVLAAVISGFTGQIFAVLWYTTLQMKVPEEMLSRVSAYDHLGSIVLAPLGIVVAGILYENFGAQTTLAISIATVAVPTLLALCVRDVRFVTSTDTGSRTTSSTTSLSNIPKPSTND